MRQSVHEPDGLLVVKDSVGADKDELRTFHLPAGQGGTEQGNPDHIIV